MEVASEESVSSVDLFYFEQSSVPKYAQQFKTGIGKSKFAAPPNLSDMNISPTVTRFDSQNAFLSVLVAKLVLKYLITKYGKRAA